MTEIAIGSLVIVVLMLALTLGLLSARRRLVPDVAVEVTVAGGQPIAARRGDKLLEVLQAAGIAIPAACGGNGTCGLCRVTARGEGAGQPQATETALLSAAERRSDTRLACQLSLRGPVEVVIPGGGMAADSFVCRVRSNRMLAPLIRELVVELPQGRGFDFRAGGFAQLTAPPYRLEFSSIAVDPAHRIAWDEAGWSRLRSVSTAAVSRAYSVASRPEDAGVIVFNIRLAVPPAGEEDRIPPGVVSSWLFALNPGDEIEVAGPFGDFFVQPTDREMVFIGGGVGMAPLRAMIHDQIGRATTRPMTFFYGARTAADLFYQEEFAAIAAAHPDFRFIPALTDPAPGDRWTGATGFIHETVRRDLERHPAPEDCEYYLCGPPVMIAAVLATLDRAGVEPRSIFNDDFGA